jgi:hypothetical protein
MPAAIMMKLDLTCRAKCTPVKCKMTIVHWGGGKLHQILPPSVWSLFDSSLNFYLHFKAAKSWLSVVDLKNQSLICNLKKYSFQAFGFDIGTKQRNLWFFIVESVNIIWKCPCWFNLHFADHVLNQCDASNLDDSKFPPIPTLSTHLFCPIYTNFYGQGIGISPNLGMSPLEAISSHATTHFSGFGSIFCPTYTVFYAQDKRRRIWCQIRLLSSRA